MVLFVLVLLGCLCAVADAWALTSTGDGAWFWQNPLPHGNPIVALDFVDAQHGWAVSSWGGETDKWGVVGGRQILVTRDGGHTWAVQHHAHGYLRSVVFVDRLNGWVAGDAALKTADGGKSWTHQGPGGADIDFVDATTGWIVAGPFKGSGEFVYRTIDGGATWATQRYLLEYEHEYGLQAVDFVGAQHGWAVGQEGRVLHTADGGATWAVQGSGTWAILRDVAFLDSQRGCAVGDGGTILITSDAGESWIPKQSGTDLTLAAVEAVSPSRFLVCGSDGSLLESTDAGLTWSRTEVGTDDEVVALEFVGDRHGWLATGSSQEGHGWRTASSDLLATEDGGLSWSPLSSSASQATLTTVDFVSPETGWTLGDGALMKTADGGLSWAAQTPGGSIVVDVDFVDGRVGWAVGATGAVLRSADGGETWAEVLAGPTEAREVEFRDRSSGWVAGGSDVWFTRDGGDVWERAPLRPTTLVPGQTVRAFDIAGEHEWWVLVSGAAWGSTRSLYHTTDAGGTWLRRDVPDPGEGVYFFAYDLEFFDGELGCAVGHIEETSDYCWLIYRTTDGGLTWDVDSGGTFWSPTLRRISIADERSAWAVGDNGALTCTIDGGETWTRQVDGKLTAGLRDVCFVDKDYGWIVGADGAILHTVTGGEPDITPPVTTQSGAEVTWHRSDVAVRFAAHDPGEPYAFGVDVTEWSLDGGAWVEGNKATVVAPADHSGDGVHTLAYRSRDNGGNVEAARSCTVRVDTAEPTATLPVAQRASGSFTVTVDDALSPTCTLEVRILKTGGRSAAAHAKRGGGHRQVAASTVVVNCGGEPQRVPLPAGLHARPYLLVVSASDLAGNAMSKPATGTLRVR
jgi:photosystem II stability/assembly factor-like uncharacterized protein